MDRILIFIAMSAAVLSFSGTFSAFALKEPSPMQAECLDLYPDNHKAYLDCLATKKSQAREAAQEEEKNKEKNNKDETPNPNAGQAEDL